MMNDNYCDSACCYSQHCSVNAVFEMISNAKAFLGSLKWKQTHIVWMLKISSSLALRPDFSLGLLYGQTTSLFVHVWLDPVWLIEAFFWTLCLLVHLPGATLNQDRPWYQNWNLFLVNKKKIIHNTLEFSMHRHPFTWTH